MTQTTDSSQPATLADSWLNLCIRKIMMIMILMAIMKMMMMTLMALLPGAVPLQSVIIQVPLQAKPEQGRRSEMPRMEAAGN